MLNMDLSKRVVVETSGLDWESSPRAGVSRIRLSREADEVGQATSLVRYEPGASFSRHSHPAGEEIFVLEGEFSDESGDYGPGTYLRNPPGSSHAPFSKTGCLLFVKLNQFAPGDQRTVCVNTSEALWHPGQGGLEVLPLHDY